MPYKVNNINTLSSGRIYMIKNKINNKIYIGQTIRTINYRFAQHVRDVNRPKNGITRAIEKYGKDNFEVSLIEEIPWEQLDERERYWIGEFNSINPNGYNLTYGGQWGGCRVLSEGQANSCITDYLNGTAIADISDKYNISISTLYRVLHSSGVELRDNKSEASRKASIENFKLATQTRQVKVYNKTLNKIYNSKKEVLMDMIKQGYSRATNWLNIRSPLDKALKGVQKTAFGFEWEVYDGGL